MDRREFMKSFAVTAAIAALPKLTLASVLKNSREDAKMKVLLVNGSPHEKGCTFTALSEIAAQLEKEGVDAEIFNIGVQPTMPCMACRACKKLGKCVIDDKVNEFVAKAGGFDGFVFGSPVHYASASGVIVPFMDRVFYSAAPEVFRLKPAAAVASARRAGTTATLDQLNKYFQIS